MEKLSILQQQILKHFFNCKQEMENVSHISKEVNALQPAVFRSIQSLIDDGYIVKESSSTHGEKSVRLTDKGAATGLLLGASYDKVENYLKESRVASGLQLLVELFKEQDNRDLLLKKGAQFLLDRDWIHKGTLGEKDKMQLIAFLLSDSRVREGFDWKDDDIIELVDAFHLNIRLLLTVLQEKQLIINSLIDRLTAKLEKSKKPRTTRPWEGVVAHHEIRHLRQDSKTSSHNDKRAKVRH